MERTAALTLAHKIESTWFDRPWPQGKASEWIDAIETLDEGAAGTAFVRLRSAGGASLTIAQFITATKAVQPHDASNRPHHERCPSCSDSGWVEIEDDRRHTDWCQDRQVCRCHAFEPCRCREGRDRAASTVWTEKNPQRSAAA